MGTHYQSLESLSGTIDGGDGYMLSIFFVALVVEGSVVEGPSGGERLGISHF